MNELIIKNNDELFSLEKTNQIEKLRYIRGYWYEEHESFNEFSNPFSNVLKCRFPRLKIVIFEECELDETFFKLFSKGYCMRNLLVLEFTGFDSTITMKQVKILTKSKLISHLEMLSLGPLENHKDILATLLSSNNFKRLRNLKLTLQEHKPEKFNVPRKTPPLLTSLELSNFNLSEGSRFLQKMFLWLMFFNLKSLNLNNALIGVEGALTLSMSPSMTKVEALSLHYSLIKDEGLMYLTQSRYFKNLKELNLRRNDLTERAIKYLSQSSICKRLRSLELEELYLNGRYLSDLFRRSNLQKLIMESNFISTRNDDFSTNETNDFFKQLTSSDFRQSLTHITLIGIPTKLNSTYRFLKTKKCKSLSNISLNYYAFGKILAKSFKSSSVFFNLKKLSLKYCWITNQGIKLLTSSKGLKNITELDLTSNKLSSKALLCLLYSSFVKNLKVLILNGNNFEKKSHYFESFFDNQKCTNLEVLFLESCELTNIHLKILIEKSRLISKLMKLNVSHNEQIDENGVEDWDNLKRFNKLKIFGIHGTSISLDALDYMYNALRDLEVLY